MKKILLAILISLCLCSPAWATSATVCDSGCDYATVALALAGVGNGNHTITVQGTYTKESTITITQSGTGVGTELLITATGTQSLPSITFTGNYIKVNGFNFLNATLNVNGDYNIINACNFRETNAAYTGSVQGIVISGDHNSFTNNNIRNQHYKILSSTSGSADATIEGNTWSENCNGADLVHVFGDGNLYKDNVFSYISYAGRKWATGEALEVGQCRASTTPITESLYWEVTTAGTTGESEPANFDLTDKAAGNTVSDGGVTWTARAASGQHPDLFQTFNEPKSNLVSKNHIFDGNICLDHCTIDTSLQLGNLEQKHSADIKDWTFRNNIFRSSRVLNVFIPGVKFYNNVFLGPATQATSPLVLGCSITHGCANNAVVKNNTVVGWYDETAGVHLYKTPTDTVPTPAARANDHEYSVNDRIYTATPDGMHVWKCTTAGTSAGSEPAGYAVNKDITVTTTSGSATLSDVSSFVGYDAGHTSVHPHYYVVDWSNKIHYMTHVNAVDAGAGTITLAYMDDDYAATANATASSVPMTIAPDCTYKTITVTDGDAVFTCQGGQINVDTAYGLDADYNHVSKGPEADYAAKTGFATGVQEAHGIGGGDPKFTSYTGTAKASFAIATDSVLKEAGVDLSGVWSSPLDTAGTSRPQGSLWDIGAYEHGEEEDPEGVPTLSSGSPSGFQSYKGTTVVLSLATDVNATCKYGTVADTAYASIANAFDGGGGKSHTATVNVSPSTSYSYYARCIVGETANSNDYAITFSVGKLVGVTISGGH